MAIVGKIDLGVSFDLPYVEGTSQEIKDLVSEAVYSNQNDAFMIGKEYSKNMLTRFKVPGEETIVEICPIAGDKFHGEFRDKGSVVGVGERFQFIASYVVKNEQEVNNFTKVLSELNKSYDTDLNKVIFELDVIASSSASRDNVGALLSSGLSEIKCVIEGNELELSIEEGHKFDLNALSKTREFNQNIFLIDTETGNIVCDFGENTIIMEEFFWQPQHSNRYKLKICDIPLTYNQAMDGLSVHLPTMRKLAEKTMDIDAISEIMTLCGIDEADTDALAKIFSMDFEEEIQVSKNGKVLSASDVDILSLV